jgi:hypothetical protein
MTIDRSRKLEKASNYKLRWSTWRPVLLKEMDGDHWLGNGCGGRAKRVDVIRTHAHRRSNALVAKAIAKVSALSNRPRGKKYTKFGSVHKDEDT